MTVQKKLSDLTLKEIVDYIGVVLGAVFQGLFLPFLIASLRGTHAGPYFILVLLSILFNFVFWPAVWYDHHRGKIPAIMWRYTFSKRGHTLLLLTGLFDALNGLLVVNASPVERTPGALGGILGQMLIPFTIVFTRIFLNTHTYHRKAYYGIMFIMIAIVISLVPTFDSISTGKDSIQFQEGIRWPFILILGQIPGVLMNITEEYIFDVDYKVYRKKVMSGSINNMSFANTSNSIHRNVEAVEPLEEDVSKKYNKVLLLAVESLYQILFMLVFVWLDILPGFGQSPNIEHTGKSLENGFRCVFLAEGGNKCYVSAFFTIIFCLSYSASYFFGAGMMREEGANLNIIFTTFSTPILIVIWTTMPKIGRDFLVTMKRPTHLEIATYLLAIIPLGIGTYLFKVGDVRLETDENGDVVPAVKRSLPPDGGWSSSAIPKEGKEGGAAGEKTPLLG